MNAQKSSQPQNPYQDVTIEDVKNIPRFSNFTDEQAQELITVLKEFSEIVAHCYHLNLFPVSNDRSTKVIELNPNHHSKAA